MTEKSKMKHCKICNNRIYNPKLIDPKDELCDKCYLKLGDVEKAEITLVLDIKIEHSSMKEIIEYLESFCNYTLEIELYDMKFKLKE